MPPESKLIKNLKEIPEELLPELELDLDEEETKLKNPAWVWLIHENWNLLDETQTKILKDKFQELLKKEQELQTLKTKLKFSLYQSNKVRKEREVLEETIQTLKRLAE